MRKLTILSLVFAVGLIAAGSLLSVKTSGQKNKFRRSNQPIAGQYIVVLNDDESGRLAEGPQVEAEAQFLSSLYGGKVNAIYATALKGYAAAMSAEDAERLSRDERVMFVEEDSEISISAVQGNAPWNLDRTDQRALPLNTNYEYTGTGAGAHVYVLDTGIRISHQEFGGRASVAFDVYTDGQNGLDCNGHGTHVAGTAVGATYGAAKNARVYSVRVLQCNGFGQISDIIRGIDWVTANRQNPAVANISLTAAGTSPALESAITSSVNSGVVFTIAAGNNQWDACDYTPARTLAGITVAASAEADDRALYSNWGPCVDLFAPGNAVTSANNGSDSATRVLSGTSMAAPLVAGIAAIYRASNPSASPATVTQAILNATTNGVVTNIDGTNSPNKLLYSWLSGGPSSTPTPTPTATPTPTPTATPTPTPTPAASGQITVKKRVRNHNGGTSSTPQFPYSATNIPTVSFALVNNEQFTDPNVQSTSQVITVTEAPVDGWALVEVECVEVAGGTPNVSNTTVDLTNRRAYIRVESGESVTCTFTSEELIPTAGGVTVSGRVVDLSGRGVRGITLALFNASNGRTVYASTNNFGFYVFEDVAVSTFYTMTAHETKRYRFPNGERSFVVNEDLANVDFVAESSR